jgi:hypothetical protein
MQPVSCLWVGAGLYIPGLVTYIVSEPAPTGLLVNLPNNPEHQPTIQINPPLNDLFYITLGC